MPLDGLFNTMHMKRFFSGFTTLFLAGLTSAHANGEAVKFKDYALGISGAALQRQHAFSCQRQVPDLAFGNPDPELRNLARQKQQAFLYQSGDTLCTPRQGETAVGLPVDASFALFSDRLEQITLRFDTPPAYDSRPDADKAKEISILMEGLTKRYGPPESRTYTVCSGRRSAASCRYRKDEYRHTWHGSDGRIELIFWHRPSLPAVLQYTSPRFDTQSANYKALWRVLDQQENERKATLEAEDKSRRARDF